ncbi:MAG: Crp/Fnr family transcriptional regulator [Candidatus Eremiobacteraeota bacterium]|nr:Crp/Fnr family transcriptional regulator [Candidatus Eremiobacteraeota bacterium]
MQWLEMGHPAEVQAGTYLWYQEDPCCGVVVLVEGELEVLEESPDGEIVVFKTLGPGALLGEMSSFDEGPHSATVRARTDCRVRRLAAEEFRRIARAQPALLEDLLLRQNERVRRLTRQIAQLGFESVKHRVGRLLLARSEAQNPIEVTHQEMAAQVAATRESVTKALGSMSRAGCLKLSRGRVEVLDRKALEAFLPKESR